MKKYLLCLAALALIGLIGCEKKGPGEEAGEQIDNMIDNVKHGDAPFKEKGTMEKMGESIDESLQEVDRK